ncbi:hypothetical protein BZA05DRAFT_421608 [Tricharina praecox]|uniref:uncharacterized protein n=1 Tax=Tricharina praecox TaxID=43433 RepID=UPI0022203037|nr:uncharacterized protein BZA05DRAFT_421608 [Tricharina praecox]KAI5844937.1 hypothetical protein BZA05DRAFT_421608 [Tricharina praecox]
MGGVLSKPIAPNIYKWKCASCGNKNSKSTKTCENTGCGKDCADKQFAAHVAAANQALLLLGIEAPTQGQRTHQRSAARFGVDQAAKPRIHWLFARPSDTPD